jgi:predicted RNA-binding protein YlxR (DUF448 family)
VPKKGHRPRRTCLGCGSQDDRDCLIRLTVGDEGRLIVDGARGRGGYLHRKQDCWKAFLGRKAVYRAFRGEISRAERERLIRELKDRSLE